MTHIPDGSHINYNSGGGEEDPNLYSWGWLGNTVPGDGWNDLPSKELFLNCIMSLKIHSQYYGTHTCEICGELGISNGSRTFTFEGISYQCPAGVDHYIQNHDYRPPKEVRDAVVGRLREILPL